MIEAIIAEAHLRKEYLTEEINTIYFGGGTPSVLSNFELNKILDELHKNYRINRNAEITLEANPDDLSQEKINELRQTPVNRLSIGVQSFFDEDLKFMNRTHSAEQAERCIKQSMDSGFENITADLIYGFIGLSQNKWERNIDTMINSGVPHISCYCMTIEPQTALHYKMSKGEPVKLNDEKQITQYEMLMDKLAAEGFMHYEISNFCKDGFISKHNSNYWKNETYSGFGPSAHSYNGNSRQWNVSNNNKYIMGIKSGNGFFEIEELSIQNKYNDYVLTSLRTMWGCDTSYIQKNFGNDFYRSINSSAKKYISEKKLEEKNNVLFLTRDGKMIADKIAEDLFVVKLN
jgi:oxygen-independent coproporphyrinogen III oxidase